MLDQVRIERALGGELILSFTSDGALALTGADAARIGLRR